MRFLFICSILIISSISAATNHPTFQNLATSEFETIEHYSDGDQWLIVMIWASDCVACNKEARSYSELHDRHKNRNAKVVGISIDGTNKRNEAIAFTQRHQISFPNLITTPDVGANYYSQLTQTKWAGTPSFLIFNPRGGLEAKQAGAIPAELLEQFLDQYANN